MMNTHIHNALSNLAVSGGRLVVSFYPTQRIHEPLSDNEELEPESNQDCDDEDDLTTGEASLKSDEEGSVDSASKPSSGSPDGSDENEEDWSKGKTISLSEKWGVRIGYLKEQEQSAAHLVPIHRNQSLPSSITCHTTQYFIIDGDEWDIIYTQDGHPIIIEKRFGAGTIILYADTYILSNEAMVSDRHPDLLAWFVGKGKEIVFDESHFGMRESMGIAGLGHKYKLQGFFLVLLILAGLFIWKNATPFIPPDDMPQSLDRGETIKKDHNAGLIKLLQRNITSNDIIAVCIKEWEKSVAQGKSFFQTKRNRVGEVMRTPGAHKDPVNTYRAIHKIISERK
jgi:hypothetical protein